MAGFDVTATPTVTAGAYSAGDIMGALLTFRTGTANAVLINEVSVMLKVAVTPALTLVLFTADPTSTTKTDNAAYSLNAADAFKVRKAIPLSTLYDHGTPNEYSSGAVNIVATPGGGDDKLYGLLIDATGVTLTGTSDVQVRLAGVPA